MKLIVEGMACAHCEHVISRAVERLGGRVRVDLAGGTVAVDGVADEAAVRAAIEAEGYQVIAQANASPASDADSPKDCCGSCRD